MARTQSACNAQESAPPQLVRLRISWGGESDLPARWRGRIMLRGGSFSELTVLDRETDSLASLSLDQTTIQINSLEPRNIQSIDVAAFASGDAQLLVELTADHLAAPFTAELPIAQIPRRASPLPIDDRGHALTVYRPPSDSLRVETNHSVLVFSPGESFSFTLRPMLPELQPGTAFDVATTLTAARNGAAVWRDEQRLPVPIDGSPTAQISIPLPHDEGCYTVHVSAAHPPGLTDRFFPVGAKHEALAERSFQIVVLKLTADLSAADSRWETVLTIDPANPRWWQRLPKWTQLSRLPGLAAGPLGSLRAGTVDHPLGRLVELPATSPRSEPHWQAYPLPLERAGDVHLLEVDYPADDEQHLGLSILEPSGSSRMSPVGRDSGVYVEGFGLHAHVDMHTHRIPFWPQSNSPLLLVTNIHPTAAAQFGPIRVLRHNGPLSQNAPRISWQTAERIVAAYFSEPLVADTFGARPTVDMSDQRADTDWQPMFEGAQRLADYLPFAGYNGAVISALGQGGATDARTLVALPKSKSILPVNDDLPKADELELYLRIFDRGGLALVPALEFAAPIPQLERMRQTAEPQSSGIEWIGADGRTWLEANGPRDGKVPYYNLLDDKVQQALLADARELLEKYGHHSSLAGLGVQLSSKGYGLLPGPEWGFDDATWGAFQRETGVIVNDRGPHRFSARCAVATREHADEWRMWRAARVTRFYMQLGQIVSDSGPNRRLLLATDETFSATTMEAQVRPNIQSSLRLDELMLSVGIDRAALGSSPGIMLTAAQFIEPSTPLVDRAIHLQLNEAVANDRRDDGGNREAALFVHTPQRRELSNFAEKSGYREHSQLVTQSSADGVANRRPYARVLSDADPKWLIEGGAFLPVGQEDATRDVRRLLQKLPADSQSTVHREQPVTIRMYDDSNRSTCVLINNCPWTADINVQLELQQPTIMQPLVGEEPRIPGASLLPQSFAAGRQPWKIQLPPYGIQGAEFSTAHVKVHQVQATIGAAAKAELEARLRELDGRDLTTPSAYQELINPGFEPTSGGLPVPGWELIATENQSKIELDATAPRDGKTCVYWQSLGGNAILQSNEFPMPATGQLFLTAFIRGENIGPTTELRMALEGVHDGKVYRQFALIGGEAAGSQPFVEKWGRPYGFGVDSVPLDSRGTMRVKFELTGPGEIWIDEVQLQDLLFPLVYYTYYQQERLEFVKIKNTARGALGDQRISDCVELLENYWPRFLMEYTRPTPPPLVLQPPPATKSIEMPAATNDDEAPEVSGFRKFLPNWIR